MNGYKDRGFCCAICMEWLGGIVLMVDRLGRETLDRNVKNMTFILKTISFLFQ